MLFHDHSVCHTQGHSVKLFSYADSSKQQQFLSQEILNFVFIL